MDLKLIDVALFTMSGFCLGLPVGMWFGKHSKKLEIEATKMDAEFLKSLNAVRGGTDDE